MEALRARRFKTAVTALTVASVAVWAEAGEVAGNNLALLNDGAITLLAADNGMGMCAEAATVCYNCTFAPICIAVPNKGYYNLGPYDCADLDANKPYCNDGVCSSTPMEKCAHSIPKAFDCVEDGFFPDPNDCQMFHFCASDLTHTVYTCSSNYVYSHARKACARKNATTDCAVINCKNTTAVHYVVYPKDHNIYGVCVRGKATVFMCADGEEFDMTTSRCRFVCKKEGLFAAEKCRKYHECVYVGRNKYSLVDWECPAGTIFSAATQGCISGTCQ